MIVLFAIPLEYLQIPILTSAMVVQPQVRTVNNNGTSGTYTKADWAELKEKCRFGHLLNNGECRCRNAQCTGFENAPLCMARDSGRHRTWPNSCYMIEHACNARKKRLYYWKGECVTTQGWMLYIIVVLNRVAAAGWTKRLLFAGSVLKPMMVANL